METYKKFKVFLVDDDVFYLNMLEQLVANTGVTDITTFQNGLDCIEQLNEKPNVIFLDHNMDVINGLDVLIKIKRVDPNVFVVMLSAQEDLKTAVDSLKYGVFDYLVKGDNEALKVQNVLSRMGSIVDEMKLKNPSLIQKIFSFL